MPYPSPQRPLPLSTIMLWLLALYAALSLYSGVTAALTGEWLLASSHALRILLIGVVVWESRTGAVPIPVQWRAWFVRLRVRAYAELRAPGAVQKYVIGLIIAFIVIALTLPPALSNFVGSIVAFVVLFGSVVAPPGPRPQRKPQRRERGPLN